MKPTSNTHNDVLSYLNMKNSMQSSPKMSTTNYSKGFGFGYNPPKSDNFNSPKNVMYQTKPLNDNAKGFTNPQKVESYIERKNSKQSVDKASKEQGNLASAIADEKKASLERNGQRTYTLEQNNTTSYSAKQYQNLKVSESLVLKEINRQEQDPYSRPKKLEINTDVSSSYTNLKLSSTYLKPGTNNRNKDTNEKVQENSINKNVQSHSSLEFVSKFAKNPNTTMSTQVTENNSPLVNNFSTSYESYPVHEEKRSNSSVPKKSTTILNKFFAQVEQKGISPPKKNPEVNLSQNASSPKGNVKINNFFAHPTYNTNLSASNDFKKTEKGLNRTTKLEQESQRQQYLNSEEDEKPDKKLFNRTHLEFKNPVKGIQDGSNSNINIGRPAYDHNNYTNTNRNEQNDLRSSQQLNLRYSYNPEVLRNSSYLSGQMANNSSANYTNNSNNYNNNNNSSNNGNNVNMNNSSNNNANNSKEERANATPSSQKTSLASFVTKVNKGDMFGQRPQTGSSEQKNSVSLNQANYNNNNNNNINSNNNGATNGARQNPGISIATNSTSYGKKPELQLDDKLFSKTPKSSANTVSLTRAVKSTTNADAQTFAFNNTSNSKPTQPQPPQQQPQQQTQQPTNYSQTETPNAKKTTLKLSMKPQLQTSTSRLASGQKEELASSGVRSTPQIYYMSQLERYHRYPDEKDYFSQIVREHFLQSFQAMAFCKYLRPVDPKVLSQKKVYLTKRESHKDKKTVVFDLDETLIHCNESLDIPYDVKLPIKFPHGEIIEAGINIRPYAVECLKELSQYFEIIVFTASHGCYANVVLDYIDPKEQYIHHRLFRESCVTTDEGIYIKDLRVLANRNLAETVIVDNAAYSFGYQIENGIPVIPFYDNKTDTELKSLVPYLKFLNSVKDIREVNKSTFKMHMYTMYDTPEKVMEKVIYTKN